VTVWHWAYGLGWHWLDVAAAVATTAAAWLAWLAIVRAGRQAKQSQDALIRERRIDYQLGVLTDLADNLCLASGEPHVEARHTTLASLLPESLVPLCRAAVGLPAPEAARAIVSERAAPFSLTGIGRRDACRELLAEEVTTAILNLLEERDRSPT
jgi:hypothetical protein